MLTLTWAAAYVLGAVAPEIARDFLARMRANAGLILIARAMRRMRVSPPRRPPHMHLLRRRRHAISDRRILGSVFRRVIRARGLVAQARAIAALLANAEPWIMRITRRRFSRLAPRLVSRDAPYLMLLSRTGVAQIALDSS